MKNASIAMGIIPSLLAVVLFYTLAMHMYFILGGWPDSIGMDLFPASLKMHADITQMFFWVLVMGTVFISPGIILICGGVKKWRKQIPFWIINGIACALCFLMMCYAAPAKFVVWWWD